MKRSLIGGKDFETSIGQGEQAEGRVMRGLPSGWMGVFFGKKFEDEGGERVWENKLVPMCERRVSSYVWKGVVHERDVWKQRAWKEVCVASSCSGVHGRISMNKPLDSCFK